MCFAVAISEQGNSKGPEHAPMRRTEGMGQNSAQLRLPRAPQHPQRTMGPRGCVHQTPHENPAGSTLGQQPVMLPRMEQPRDDLTWANWH